jgi:hypothetical protein
VSLMKLEKSDWQNYFDNMSKILEGKRAEIEVDALAIGAQIEADWVPLIGITYDRKSDVLEVAVEGLDHMIAKPAEIWIDQAGTELSSVEAVDNQGYRHIIKLHDPLMLPMNQAGASAPLRP